MITNRMAAEIAGWIPPAECGAADHPITADERDFAIEIAREMDPKLDDHVSAFRRKMAEWDAEYEDEQ
jgi:hypothetical protein